MAIDHVEVALVDRQVHRLADRAAELMETRGHGLNFGKKSLDIDEWLIRAKSVLARLENDGAGDTLIRRQISEKLNLQGQTSPWRRE